MVKEAWYYHTCYNSDSYRSHFLRICKNITKKKVLMTLRVASRRIVNYNGRAITDVTTWFRKSSHGQRSRQRKLPRACVPAFICVRRTFRNRGLSYYENTKLLGTGYHLTAFGRELTNAFLPLVKQWKMWHVVVVGPSSDSDESDSTAVGQTCFFYY